MRNAECNNETQITVIVVSQICFFLMRAWHGLCYCLIRKLSAAIKGHERGWWDWSFLWSPLMPHLLILYVQCRGCISACGRQNWKWLFLMICVSCVIVNVCVRAFVCLSYNIKAEVLKHFASLTENQIRESRNLFVWEFMLLANILFQHWMIWHWWKNTLRV